MIVYLGKSPVHGKGVFAVRDIWKGEVVGRYESRPTTVSSERNRYVLELYDEDGKFLEYRLGINEFKYINHSSDPNVEMGDELEFIALRDIKQDEELLWYYGDEFEADLEG